MHDVFLSHATEDKEEVARPLADNLSSLGLDVWYDEFSLSLGDSLRESIDKGLANSKYGIVILSPSFFDKKWPQNELNALFAMEREGEKLILPIWHNIDENYLRKVSPLLADRVAVKTNEGTEKIVRKIVAKVKPEMAFKLIGKDAIVVCPTQVVLFKAGWKHKTSVMVSNFTDTSLFKIYIKVTVLTKGVASESVLIEVDSQSALAGRAGPVITSYDHFRFDCIDEEGRECIYTILSCVKPRTSREMIIQGTKNIDSIADVRVIDFGHEPLQVLEKDNQTAIPFMPRERLKIKSYSTIMRRDPSWT